MPEYLILYFILYECHLIHTCNFISLGFFSSFPDFLNEDSLEYETKIWKDCKAFSVEEESLSIEVTKARAPKDFKLVEG